ncbi:MAG: hypothetical protein DMG12_20370 [Acidobacteria bacterium]|nr:MAG: hypothetical protein DMG12_20370 [Acidobacteriota bacterium]
MAATAVDTPTVKFCAAHSRSSRNSRQKLCSGFCLAYAAPRGAHDAFGCVPKQGAVQHAFAVDITPHNRNHAASGNIAVAARACNTSYLPASGNPKRNGQQFRKPMRIPNATVSSRPPRT